MNNTTTENQEDEQAVSSTQRINKEILQNVTVTLAIEVVELK